MVLTNLLSGCIPKLAAIILATSPTQNYPNLTLEQLNALAEEQVRLAC